MPSGGTDAKTKQGIAASGAAKAAGVHLVFTSVGSATRRTGIPHFDSKYEVEKHIAKVGVRATILAPVAVKDAGRFTGKRFDLASDELTGNDALAIRLWYRLYPVIRATHAGINAWRFLSYKIRSM